MWFSSPNKPIVFSDSILQTSYVKVIPSVGSRTNPTVVLSEVSACNLLLPDACLCTEYLPSESSVSAPNAIAYFVAASFLVLFLTTILSLIVIRFGALNVSWKEPLIFKISLTLQPNATLGALVPSKSEYDSFLQAT